MGVNQRQLRLTPSPKGKPRSACGGGGLGEPPPHPQPLKEEADGNMVERDRGQFCIFFLGTKFIHWPPASACLAQGTVYNVLVCERV